MSDDVSLTQVLLALGVFAGGIAVAAMLRVLLVRLLDRGDADRYAGKLVGRFVGLVVVMIGAVYALGLVGIRVGPLLGALGVGGIALAFAAQDILQNFVAGVLLQVRRPFRVGDQIRSGEFDGVIRDVNLRTVELTTYDGLTVYLPNAEVLKAPIVNYTRTPNSRTSLTVGVAYDTDLRQARETLQEACASAEGVREDPPPEVWVEEFADSSINLAVRYWHRADIASMWRVRSAVAMAVKEALDRAEITIPFPQSTLWFGPGSTTLHVRQPQDGADPEA
ncbi:mechanosensitive ion channel family protein [Nocardioides donggukensis]|uniref:Mechanosensitive ion channel family protein n=1 Tax=Nocardioides donggukensis TaxID=2774019 RepID=A0A927K8V9_9ACTN|nr:mechanosensitive ion channel family protein [Nocardioides donggukensis]MBD8869906.1 mechanosensitive ion channel family protein [Nocardioides donggukensis]